MTATPPIELARRLARLSAALAAAAAAGDLDDVERLLAARAAALAERAAATPPGPAEAAELAGLGRAIEDADRRTRASLEAVVANLRGELARLGLGARAARAYLAADPVAPGWIDRRD